MIEIANEVCNLPILVTAFNRPDLLRGLLAQLESLQAKKVYIAIDGPRLNHENDSKSVSECRAIATVYLGNNKSRLRISDSNQGCKNGMNQAISWFFENEESGLILEDDIRIHKDFLNYVDTALKIYKFDFSIGTITGFNPLGSSLQVFKNVDSFLHPYFCSWGWATWRDRWNSHNLNRMDWRENFDPRKLNEFGGVNGRRFWIKKFDSVWNGEVDTWDYQFMFTNFANNWACVAPKHNLVSNFGFRLDATHTTQNKLPTSLYDGNLPIDDHRWPNPNLRSKRVDNLYLAKQFGIISLPRGIMRRFNCIFYRSK
jgi:hypothetical protein